MNSNKFNKSIINILTSALVCAFFICDLLPYGSLIIAGISILILIVQLIIRHGKIRLLPCELFKYMLLFALYSGVSAIWASNRSYSIQQCITITELVICIYVLYMNYSRYDSFLDLCKILLYSAIIVSVYCILTAGIGTILVMIVSGHRLLLDFTSINMVALLDTYAIIISIYLYVFEKQKWYIFFSPLLMLIIIASETRKGFIALSIGVLLILYFKKRSKSILKNACIVLFVICLGVLVFRVISTIDWLNPIIGRIQIAINAFTGDGYVDNSTRQRAEMISIGIEQFKKTPIFGMGMGNPRLLLLGFWGKNYPYLHNNYVEILAGGGIIGLVLYYLMYVYIVKKLFVYRKYLNKEKYILWTMIAIIILMDYMMVSYYSKITYFYLLILYIGIEKIRIQASR